jgi:hypothetical protein
MTVASVRRSLSSGAGLVVVLLVVLLIVNAFLNPVRLFEDPLTTLGLAAPLILAALATTP